MVQVGIVVSGHTGMDSNVDRGVDDGWVKTVIGAAVIERSAAEEDKIGTEHCVLGNILSGTSNLYECVHSSSWTPAYVALVDTTVHRSIVGERIEFIVERYPICEYHGSDHRICQLTVHIQRSHTPTHLIQIQSSVSSINNRIKRQITSRVRAVVL